MFDEKFVVSWNKSQQGFSVETLREHILANLSAFDENTDSAFAMLGIFDTHEEASEFCLPLQDIRNKRLDNEES